MSLSRRINVGALTLVSVAALTIAAAPSVDASAEVHDGSRSSLACSNSWKNAVGLPGRWTKVSDSSCAVFGSSGYKENYQWTAERGKPCIKVKGFKNGREKWYDAGCGKSGTLRNVPWGNVAANKAIKVKGAALFKWR